MLEGAPGIRGALLLGRESRGGVVAVSPFRGGLTGAWGFLFALADPKNLSGLVLFALSLPVVVLEPSTTFSVAVAKDALESPKFDDVRDSPKPREGPSKVSMSEFERECLD